MKKWIRKRIEDKERRIAINAFSFIGEEYGKEISKFAFLSNGTALTIHRDKVFNDTDIDFSIYTKDIPKLYKFIKDNNMNLLSTVTYKNKITEVKLLYRGINVDFFVIDDFINKNDTLVYWMRGNKFTSIWQWKGIHNKLEFKTFNHLKYISNDSYFLKQYGKSWTTKLEYTFQFRSDSSEIKKVIIYDKNILDEFKYYKKDAGLDILKEII